MENDENKRVKSESALREEEILKFWKENDIFKKSLEKESPNGEYVFYEGPPTANGKPGIHHLEARAFKDAIPRYKTMKGYHVRRKGGWDTHGLPVELQVEKKLNLSSKKAIEEYGIAKFNKECKESVWEYTDLWEKFTERMGYWVDQENPYVTYHNNYIESVWNVIKNVNDKNLLYKDYKIVPWCPRCGTTLSSHELAQGYQDVKDLSVYVKFKVKGQENTYILAWTTTPWTLPGNVALAVGEKITYSKFEALQEIEKFNLKKGEIFFVAESAIERVFGEYLKAGGKLKPLDKIKGSDLVGLEYEPLFPYLENTISKEEKSLPEGATSLQAGKLDKAFKVYDADFVTTEDGTGVVHTAVMYGQDDFELGNVVGLPKHHLVGLDGKFLAGTGFLEGRFVKEVDEKGKPTLAVDIIEDLKKRNLFFKQENYQHSYPHCWRCKTALIYYARDSWYIKMSDPEIKKQLIEENKSINWEPSYIKEGRFGEWLKDIKDWAISRERYWGTPLPVWICDKCNKKEVIGSIEELKSKTKKSGNKYWVIRHGESESNIKEFVTSSEKAQVHLTELGKEQVLEATKKSKSINIDLIFSSPLTRTKETAEIIQKEFSLNEEIIFDRRLKEVNFGDYEGLPYSHVKEERSKIALMDKFYISFPNGESFKSVYERVLGFLYELESKYNNKNILIVSHGDPIWIIGAINILNSQKRMFLSRDIYPQNAEFQEVDFVSFPHNENYELDLHKPFIDEVNLICNCGGNLKREKEVMDVWLDSGTMPFSQDHYPFENKELVDGPGYPADFISEAIDQTRGWFYTLHAVGVLMGRGRAYNNVICLGLLLDAKGKKMSKSLGNIVDPWTMMDKYGVDTIRLWMYGVNQPGDAKSFDEKTVADLHNKVFNLLYNVLAFYELYRDPTLEILEYKESKNILDQWIVARLGELLEITTDSMEEYKLLEPVRALRDFMDDLSTWYLRRSRDRIKEEVSNLKEQRGARTTLYYVLKTLIKIMAPFAPFAAEDIWQKLRNEKDPESVHLVSWPELDRSDLNLINEMKEVREIVTLGLQGRQKAGIPVRQPLNKITITGFDFAGSKNGMEYFDIIREELNIKNLYPKEDSKTEKNVELDTNITEELKQEGNYRELVRAIQDMRKKNGLNPNDIIILEVGTSGVGKEFINKWQKELLKAVGAKDIQVKDISGNPIKISDLEFVVNVVK